MSVNEYVTRLVRVAVGGPATPARAWKAAGVAEGWLMDRPRSTAPRRSIDERLRGLPEPVFPPGYRNPIIEERDEHR